MLKLIKILLSLFIVSHLLIIAFECEIMPVKQTEIVDRHIVAKDYSVLGYSMRDLRGGRSERLNLYKNTLNHNYELFGYSMKYYKRPTSSRKD